MKYSIKIAGLIILALMLLPFANNRKAGAEKTARKILKHEVNAPIEFVPNDGQTDTTVRYSAHTSGADFYFTPREAVFRFVKGKKGNTLRLVFIGAQPEPRIEGTQPTGAKINYLIGSDKNKWHTNLSAYGEVVYRNLWPGIDLAFRGERGKLKYEFHVAPGADPGNIRLAYRGVDSTSLSITRELIVRTSLGEFRDEKPFSYVNNG